MKKNLIFAYAKTKTHISCAITAQLIIFVFATWVVPFLLYLYPKFQDSSFLLWVYRPVCVGPGQKFPNSQDLFSRVTAHKVLHYLTMKPGLTFVSCFYITVLKSLLTQILSTSVVYESRLHPRVLILKFDLLFSQMLSEISSPLLLLVKTSVYSWEKKEICI